VAGDRFLQVKRGFGVDVSIIGLAELEKGLRSFDPTLARIMNREFRDALTPVVKEAQRNVPAVALSGWDATGDGEWSTRLGWDSGQVAKGIKVRKGAGRTRRRTRGGVQVAWRIVNENPAGAVFELAGRRNGGSAMGQALTGRHGQASRLIWDAWEKRGSQVEPKIRMAVANAERALQAAVDGMV
jgi:hypothetical protein